MNNLNENKLNKIVSESIKTVINEKSISQKKRDNKDVERFFRKGKGGFNNIKSLVVFTAENPDSTELPRSENKKLNKSLLNTIKSGGYKYVPAIGQFYGNPEHPYVVFNMSLDTAKHLCGHFQQTSFVWSELMDDGNIHSEYWEKQDVSAPYNPRENDYVVKDECNDWLDQYDAEDGFTAVGKKFKYSIPFSIFKSLNENFGKNLKRIVESERLRGNTTITENKILNFSINRKGQSPMLYRKAIIRGC